MYVIESSPPVRLVTARARKTVLPLGSASLVVHLRTDTAQLTCNFTCTCSGTGTPLLLSAAQHAT